MTDPIPRYCDWLDRGGAPRGCLTWVLMFGGSWAIIIAVFWVLLKVIPWGIDQVMFP